MEESKDLQCLISQRLQRPGFARMISWEFSKISNEEQISTMKIQRRKRTKGYEEYGSVFKEKAETDSLSQNFGVCTITSTDSVDKSAFDTHPNETNSSTESEDSEYFSAPEDVEIFDDDTSTGTEESFETTRTSNDVLSSTGACNTSHPSERKRRPSKKQKRKRRQEMKCVYINDLFVISNLFDLEHDISEANDDGVTPQNPVSSLVQLCLKAASQISEDEKSEIPVGIKKLMSSRNQINSFQRLQLSWLQNNVLASFEPKNIFTKLCLYEDIRKVITHDTSKGIHSENHVSLFLPTRNILNSIICCKHKSDDMDQVYKGSKVSSYLLNANICSTSQSNLLQTYDYRQLIYISVHVVSCLSALASCIDLMLPPTFSERLVRQKRIILGDVEATRAAKETMYIRVRKALEKRFPTVVEHLFDIALPFVMWSRGNIQSATEMFINLAKAEKRSRHKAMYLSEVARMSLQFGDIEKGVRFHRLAADTALEKSRYSDAQIDEVNEQMLVLIASAYDQGPMLPSKARQAGHSWNNVLHLPSLKETNAIAAITSFLCYHGYHWTDSNWLQEAKLRLQRVITSHPYLRYHLCMLQALLGEEKESKLTFMQFTNSPDVHGPTPGIQVVRMLGNQVRNPWQPLCDMVKNQVTSVQPIKVEWRTQLLHPRNLNENMNSTTDGKYKGELYEADNIGSNLSLRISSNGYLTGDMYLRLPSMRSVYLDPYTGVLSIDQIPGQTEPWQTLSADGSSLPYDMFIPTLLELYRDDKGQTVTLNAPHRIGQESCSGMQMVWLHWAGASGEKAKINLFQLIKSERKMAIDKTIEEMTGKTQQEKAEMKKMCQLYYDHNYICSISSIESAIQKLAASKSEDIRRAQKKKKPVKKKKYFYLVDNQFTVALHKNKRVGTNILLDFTVDGIHEFVVINCTDKQSFLSPAFLKKNSSDSLVESQYASSARIIVLSSGNELGLFSTEGEKLDTICNKKDIIHHEKQMCVVGSAIYAVGKALDSIFCKCSCSSAPEEKWPFLDYNAPEKEIQSIQIMADELLLIHSKMGISFMNPQNLELVPIQIGQKGSLTLTEDSKVILGNFEVFSILGTKTWQEEDRKITHVGIGLNHQLIIMEMMSYPISFDQSLCGLPIRQNRLKLIITIPMPGVPMEVCFINRSVGFFVSITQHLNCTSYYQEMILQIDYFGKLRGVLPCLGPGPRSFFKCYLHGDPDLQANNRDQGQAGTYVYLRDGHDGIMAIRPAM